MQGIIEFWQKLQTSNLYLELNGHVLYIGWTGVELTQWIFSQENQFLIVILFTILVS